MRPERFRYEMDKAFDHWFLEDSAEKFIPLLREMNRVWVKWSKEENDCRGGDETYGYRNAASVINNMFYISDRWRCAFRLKWLIDGLESKRIA